MKKGFFITLEGIESCGKTTNIKYIGEILKKKIKNLFLQENLEEHHYLNLFGIYYWKINLNQIFQLNQNYF